MAIREEVVATSAKEWLEEHGWPVTDANVDIVKDEIEAAGEGFFYIDSDTNRVLTFDEAVARELGSATA